MLMCSQRGGRDKKFSEFFVIFWRVGCKTQMSPPVACPVIHNFGSFHEFLTFLMGMFCIGNVVGK